MASTPIPAVSQIAFSPQLRRQGERYFAGDLRDLSGDRCPAILAVCVLEWRSALADAIVETHDRIVGKTLREAKSRCGARAEDAKTAPRDTLKSFASLGSALLKAYEDRASLEEAVGRVLSQSSWFRSGLRCASFVR